MCTDKPKAMPILTMKPDCLPLDNVCCDTKTKSGPGEAAANKWIEVIKSKPCIKSITGLYKVTNNEYKKHAAKSQY